MSKCIEAPPPPPRSAPSSDTVHNARVLNDVSCNKAHLLIGKSYFGEFASDDGLKGLAKRYQDTPHR